MSAHVAMTVAGSDCSAGAGLQADLKTFHSLDVYGLSAVTCVVAEVPGKVSRIEAMSAETLREQVALLLKAFPVGAMKTGMLYSVAHIKAFVEILRGVPPEKRPPVVVDPVMVATSGDALIEDDAVAAYRTDLFPFAALVTPNSDEAAVLLGRDVGDSRDDAIELAKMFGTSFLLKGGHLRDSAQATDWLARPDGETESFSADFVEGVKTHGTGCTYSAAIAAGLAKGEDLTTAVRTAKYFVTEAIRGYFRWPGDIHALNHSPDFVAPTRR